MIVNIANNLCFKRITWPLGKLIFFFFKLQTPASFAQSVQELTIALQRTGDPANLNRLRPHLELLANIDPSPGKPRGDWQRTASPVCPSAADGFLNYFLSHSSRIPQSGYFRFFLQYFKFLAAVFFVSIITSTNSYLILFTMLFIDSLWNPFSHCRVGPYFTILISWQNSSFPLFSKSYVISCIFGPIFLVFNPFPILLPDLKITQPSFFTSYFIWDILIWILLQFLCIFPLLN